MRMFVIGFFLILIGACITNLWAANSHGNGKNVSENKLYVIESAFTGRLEETVTKRDNLGRSIATLAQQVNEPVWFHDYKEPMAGAPVIILECSKEFIEQVKNLPEYVKSYDLQPSVKTERSASIQRNFSAAVPSTKEPDPH